MIDMASVYAERYKQNPQALQAAVMGQSPDPKLDPYTALNALRLVKESNMMAMAGKAQQPTSSPSIVSEAMTPPTPPQGLAAMMPMGAPAGQMPQQAPQAPVMQASGGLAGLPTADEDYANGGIVAFAGPTKENNDSLVTTSDNFTPEELDNLVADSRVGSEDGYDTDSAPQSVQDRANAAQEAYANFNPADMTPEEIKKVRKDYFDFLTANAGEDIYTPAQQKLTAREAALANDRRQGEGLAYLTAAGKILKGHNLAMGASEALPAFAQQMGEVQKADQQERRSIEQMNFALADAKRKERKGDLAGAQAAVESARKFQQDANKAKGDKLRYSADIATRNVQYARLAKGAGANGPKVAERLADAEYDNLMATNKPKPGESDKAFEARIRAQALRITQKQINEKANFSLSDNPEGGPKARGLSATVQQRIDAKVADSMKSFPTMNTAYRKAQREGNTAEAQRLWNAEETRWRGIHSKAEKAAGAGTAEEPIKLD